MKKAKCLLLLPRLPFPPVGGDKLRFYYLLQMLSTSYDLEVVVITDEEIDTGSLDYIKQYTSDYKIFSYSRWRCRLNVLRGILSSLPLQVSYYHFRKPKRYIKNRLQCCDFCFACLIRTALYVEESDKYKFHDMTDSIAINYRYSAKKVKSLFWLIIYHLEVKRLFKFEKRMIRTFDNTFLVNYREYRFWRNIGHVTFIPNGVSEELLSRFTDNMVLDKYRDAIVFFGKMDYQPNIDAVMWFFENVVPYLSEDIRFVILGTRPTSKIKKIAVEYENVEVTGYMKDPYRILKACLAVVAPMQTGAGIQNKILESMALGKIVLTSSLGAAPILGANNMEHLIISDEGKDIAKTINNIRITPLKYQFIGNNAHKFIKDNYTWKIYEGRLINTINSTILS